MHCTLFNSTKLRTAPIFLKELIIWVIFGNKTILIYNFLDLLPDCFHTAMDPKLWFAPENLWLHFFSPGVPWSWIHSASHWDTLSTVRTGQLNTRHFHSRWTISTHFVGHDRKERFHTGQKGLWFQEEKTWCLDAVQLNSRIICIPFKIQHYKTWQRTVTNTWQRAAEWTWKYTFGGYKEQFTCVISSCWKAQKLKWKRL